MNKFFTYLIILFGFLLMPSISLACENSSTKHSSKKEITSETCNKDCCNKDCCKKDSHSKNKNHDGCNGKCGHSNCVTTSTQSSAIFSEIKFNNSNFSFLEKKSKFYDYETTISSGFNSLWLIPKIG
ncbi:hypothetical protein [Flavobacterium granuli]|uniref:Lipoprotein n=1 Tax=Flavobacterium granuli TaxID=280093 RepID=A0ABU1S2V1_9FLAO|nr:hypothetical protein [Flavobacterium granuli]MDR6845351.1 hypothetical protein [Flavobacterium granuli]